MSKLELEQIWSNQLPPPNLESWLSKRKQPTDVESSSGVARTRNRLLIFDSIYKALVMAGYIFLVFLGSMTLSKIILALFVTIGGSILIVRNQKMRESVKEPDETKDVLSVLKEKYAHLKQLRDDFIISSSVTYPFFVLAGFQLYYFLKYHESGLATLLSDPVTYVFLLLAFLFPLITQRMSYQKELKELSKIIDIGLNEIEQSVNLINLQGKKRTRNIIFTFLAFLGVLVLLLILTLAI